MLLWRSFTLNEINIIFWLTIEINKGGGDHGASVPVSTKSNTWSCQVICQHFLHVKVQDGTRKCEEAHSPGPEDLFGRWYCLATFRKTISEVGQANLTRVAGPDLDPSLNVTKFPLVTSLSEFPKLTEKSHRWHHPRNFQGLRGNPIDDNVFVTSLLEFPQRVTWNIFLVSTELLPMACSCGSASDALACSIYRLGIGKVALQRCARSSSVTLSSTCKFGPQGPSTFVPRRALRRLQGSNSRHSLDLWNANLASHHWGHSGRTFGRRSPSVSISAPFK